MYHQICYCIYSYLFSNVNATCLTPTSYKSFKEVSVPSYIMMTERSSISENMFALFAFDDEGKLPPAYNKSSMLPEPILRYVAAMNNSYEDPESNKKYRLFSKLVI